MKKTTRIIAGIVLGLSALCGQAFAQVIYSHNFDSLGGWPDSDAKGDINGVYTVVGSEYVINPLQNNTYILALAPIVLDTPDIIAETTVRLSASQPESRAGIACRVSPGLNFYHFGLVAKGMFEIVRVTNGRGTVLASGQFPVGTLDNVKLRAECSGSNLILSANGRELGRASDVALPAGNNVGLVSISPVIAATNAAFDDFTVSRSGSAGTAQMPAQVGNVTATITSTPTGGGGAGTDSLPQIEDIALHNDMGGKPGERQSLFNVGPNRVYVVMQLSGNTKVKFTAKWFAVQGSQETFLLESAYDNVNGNSRLWLYADRNWTAGLYRADIYANGQRIQDMEFSVY